LSAFATRTASGWRIAVHAQPGAKRSEVVGLHGEALKVRIAAPALDGRANSALEALVADRLGIACSRVRVVRGARSRDKRLAVDAPDVDPGRLLGSTAPRAT
jgi:uncharacterized protein (TIGR00251 family)